MPLAIRVRELFNGLSDDQMRVVFTEYTREMGRRDNGQDLDSTQDADVKPHSTTNQNQ